ncbi:MAG TPA: ABC transporter substrate-binding protein [Stellaceae bacterium]|nr:ABC transporter substrate-binding protein [Stellaceae bacterium]
MKIPARLIGALVATLFGATVAGQANADESALTIGVLTDLSSFAASSMGPGSVVATRLAVKDFGGTVLGKPIKVIAADMQSRPDLAVTLAQHWYDVDGVDVIVDVPASAAALTIQRMAYEKHKMFLATVAATSALTGNACTPTGVHWGLDTQGTADTMVAAFKADNVKNWFLIMPDYAVGKAVAAATQAAVAQTGGHVVQTIFFPPNTTEYSQYLLGAQQSGADVIGVGAIGRDLVTLIKQAVEFRILPSSKQRLAAFLMNISDVDAVGLTTLQGIWLVQDFYWDTNDQTRAYAKKFFAIHHKMPNFTQSANYSGVIAYLTAVKAVGSDDPLKVVTWMKSHTLDHFGKPTTLRADGRAMFDVELYRVKSPAESKYPWDYLKLVKTIPADQVFPPLAQSTCPLIKKN